METSVRPFALLLHSLPSTHISTLSGLGPLTDCHIFQSHLPGNLHSLREPAELLISCHAFYISTYLFRQMVWIHYLSPLTWYPLLGSSNRFSTREGKPGAKGNHIPRGYESSRQSQMLTTGLIGSPRQGKKMSQAQHSPREPTVGPKSKPQHQSKVSQETRAEAGVATGTPTTSLRQRQIRALLRQIRQILCFFT